MYFLKVQDSEVIQQQFQNFVAPAGPWEAWAPEQSVMDNQEVRTCRNNFPDRSGTRVNRRGNFRN